MTYSHRTFFIFFTFVITLSTCIPNFMSPSDNPLIKTMQEEQKSSPSIKKTLKKPNILK